ncbi:MAG TPA: oligosaccharide flippase family protein [Steroidobacteraceae bacterium]|nr:oligosaccharide flippase family protein [Steroidobacteraceae bacterium]
MLRHMRGSAFRRNVSWQFIGSMSQSALSALVLLVMGRGLGAEGFGQYSIIIGFITVANLLMEPRMQDVAARVFWNLGSDPTTRPGHRESFLDFVAFEIVAKMLPLLGVVLLAGPIADLANLPEGSALLIAIAASGNFLAKIGYGVSTGILRVLGRSDQFTFCGSGELAVRLITLLVLMQLGELTVASSVITLSVTLMLSNLVQLWLAAHHIGGVRETLARWKLASSPRRLVDHRRLLLSNIGLSAADLMNKDLDITLLSPVMPAETIGVYKMAKNIALITWRAVDPFYLALMPELNRRVQLGDFAGTRSLIRRSILGLGALTVTLSATVFIAVWFLGTLLFGPEFAGIPPLLALMLVGVVGSAPLVWGHPLAVALNRNDTAFVGSLIGSAIGLAAFFTLVNVIGIRGAAISWSLSFLPAFWYTSWVARRLLARRMSESVPAA